MSFDWVSALNLPDETLSGDMLVSEADLGTDDPLTKLEKKKLLNMESLAVFATLTKANTYMLPVISDAYHINTIIVLRCVLKTMRSPLELGDTIHKRIPYPTVLLFEAPDGCVGISVAIKRKSLARHDAFVIEQTQGTGLFDPNAKECEPIFEQISYDALPQNDLLSFVSALATRCMLSGLIPLLGFYPDCKEQYVDALLCLVKQLKSLQSEVSALESIRKDKETTFAESTKVRMTLNEKMAQRDKAVEKIGNLCNG